MRILALDLASKKTGWGLLNDDQGNVTLDDYGLIHIKGDRIAARLAGLWDELPEVIRQTRPDVVVVEDAYYNPKRPQAFPALMQARGVVFLICEFLGIPTATLTASSAKKRITGNGRSKKPAVMEAVKKRFTVLADIKNDDITDAVALGLAVALEGGQGTHGILPQPVGSKA